MEYQPLIVALETPLTEVISLMQEWGNSCRFEEGTQTNTFVRANNSCVLVVQNNRLKGIFTERDLVKLIAAGFHRDDTVAEVMTREVVTLTVTDSTDVFTALNLLRQHRIRHLPVVDRQNNLIGLVTAKNLRQTLQPVNLMKWRKVSEIMETGVIYTHPEATVRQIARLMANNRVSCIAIAQPLETSHSNLVRPVGIITERDLLQFQNLNLDLEQPASKVMSAPLLLVDAEDTLWSVQQQMQQRRVRRLLVGSAGGELKGIVTQTSLLKVFDSVEMYEVIETLKDRVCQLEREKNRLLENRSLKLAQKIAQRTSDLESINQRLQQEIELRQENERRFDSILNSLQDLVWAVSPDTFEVLYVNPAVEDIYDRSPEEFYANSNLWWEVIHPADRNRLLGFYQHLLAEGSQDAQYRIIRPDGWIRYLLDRFQVIYNSEGIVMRLDGITTDITQRKRREEILRDIAHGVSVEVGANFFASLVEYLSKTLQVDYAFVGKVIEPEANSIETIVVRGAEKTLDNFSYELAGTPCGNTVDRGLCIYPQRVRELFPNNALLEEMAAESYGGMPILDTAGKVLGIIAVVHSQSIEDVSLVEEVLKIFANRARAELERQQAETALRESQQRYALAVAGSSNGIWDWNILTNEIFYAPRFKEILDCSDEEFPNTFEAWSTRLHPADCERVLVAVRNHISNRIPYNIEYRLLNKQGEYRWIQARGQAIWDEEGRAVRMAGSIADVSDRKRSELKLQQSEKKFRAIFDNTFQFIGLLEPNGNFIEGNKAALDFIGLTSADLRGKPFWTAPWWSMSSETQELIKQAIAKAAKGEFIRFEVDHPGTKGRVITVDFSLTPIKDEAGQVVLLIPEGRNISDRKKVESKLQKSNQILRAISSIQTQFLSDAKPSVIFDGLLGHLLELTESEYGFIGEIIIAEDGSPIMEESYMKFRGRPYLKTHAITNIAWNEETRAFYAENAPKGMEFHNLQTLFGAVIVTGEPVIANSPSDDPRRGGLPDGHPPLNAFLGVPFYKNNKMTGMAGIANRSGGYDEDIIDYLRPLLDTCSRIIEASKSDRARKQAENKIQEQAALLDIATDAIMVRGLDDRILYWNRGAEKMYGWTKAEALNRKGYELLYREYPTELSKVQQAVVEQGEWQGELKQITKAGKDIIIQSRWSLVRDEAGNPFSYLIVKSDITEQKQLEAQFLRAQRLESLGTLAGGIAHDLNNIFSPILGFAKLLPSRLPHIDEQTRGFFQIMETNARRGTDLVKQILTFARGLDGDRGTLQIRHIVAEIVQVIRETFPKNIELTVNIASNLRTIEGDATQIHQVLMNLVVNARDAMELGGQLTIAVENFSADPEFARMHLDATEGDYVLVTVADTGEGIPAVILDRIFEPFFTTKEVEHGTGLGLSTAIGIVKSHGGFIDVESQVGRGTKFRVFLPAIAEPMTAISPVETALPQGNGELILVVDDESSIRAVTKAILKTFNYRVLTAKDGLEAIAIYTQHQHDISLVILDLMMPSMDGQTTILALKQMNPEVKAIAISGLITSREMLAQLEGKFTAFISKPYSAEELLTTVYQVVSD